MADDKRGNQSASLQTRFAFLSGVCIMGQHRSNQLHTPLQSSYLLTPIAHTWENGSETPWKYQRTEKAKSSLAGTSTQETLKAFSIAALHKSHVLTQCCSWSACAYEFIIHALHVMRAQTFSSTHRLPGSMQGYCFPLLHAGQLVILLLTFLFCPLSSMIPLCICKENLKPHLNATSPPASVRFRAPNIFVNPQVDKMPGTSDSKKDRGGGNR